jgi:uncharacterized protein
MLVVISPAKTIDESPQKIVQKHTLPDYLAEAELLVTQLRKFTPPDLEELMLVNPSIARLNFERYVHWHLPFNAGNAKQALLTFKGDVYRTMRPGNFTLKEFEFAQQHLRILSGLYGVLRPLDLIQPYRLEMGTHLSGNHYKNLYQFWDGKITETIQKHLKSIQSKTLINLASAEYFKAIHLQKLKAEIITPQFYEERNGKVTMISIYAKMARGAMTSFIIRNKITDCEQIKLFDEDGYRFNTNLSGKHKWIFTR